MIRCCIKSRSTSARNARKSSTCARVNSPRCNRSSIRGEIDNPEGKEATPTMANLQSKLGRGREPHLLSLYCAIAAGETISRDSRKAPVRWFPRFADGDPCSVFDHGHERPAGGGHRREQED